MNPDVLAELADPELSVIWEQDWAIKTERRMWCAVMEKQQELQPSLGIPDWAIGSSRWFAEHVPPDTVAQIDERERVTRHDLKARLEVFCEQAGHEFHHLGMTSADIVDNLAQVRMLESMRWLDRRHDITLPAIGRFAMRGIKGAVGTQQDQLDLLGSAAACRKLDYHLAAEFRCSRVMGSVGQVYPRSQDLEVVSELLGAVAGRLRPERRPYLALLAGYQSMCAAYSGGQWNEGDVSTSVVRRLCLPGAWRAAALALAD